MTDNLAKKTLHIPLIFEESLNTGRITAKLIFVKSFATYIEAEDFFKNTEINLTSPDEIRLTIER